MIETSENIHNYMEQIKVAEVKTCEVQVQSAPVQELAVVKKHSFSNCADNGDIQREETDERVLEDVVLGDPTTSEQHRQERTLQNKAEKSPLEIFPDSHSHEKNTLTSEMESASNHPQLLAERIPLLSKSEDEGCVDENQSAPSQVCCQGRDASAHTLLSSALEPDVPPTVLTKPWSNTFSFFFFSFPKKAATSILTALCQKPNKVQHFVENAWILSVLASQHGESEGVQEYSQDDFLSARKLSQSMPHSYSDLFIAPDRSGGFLKSTRMQNQEKRKTANSADDCREHVSRGSSISYSQMPEDPD